MKSYSSILLALIAAPLLISCLGSDISSNDSNDGSNSPSDTAGSGDNANNGSGSGDGGGGSSGGGGFVFPIPGPQFETRTQTIHVNATGAVDILFVIDNSGSMSQEQSELANRISGFMDLTKDLDWQIAMTTTDPRNGTAVNDPQGVARPWGDGQFRPFGGNTGNHFILRAGEQSQTVAQNLLAQAISVGINGSGTERGIHATYRAVERSASSAAHSDFFRPNAALAVIVISDEDECSNGGCLNNQPTSVPENLVNYVEASFGSQKSFEFHSIVWIPGDTTCSTGAHQGNVYQQLSQLTNGIMGSVCANNYSSLLQDIGDKVLEQVEFTQLTCQPADITFDGVPDIFVTLASGEILMISDVTVQGSRVNFNNPLPEGTHEVTYYCLREGFGQL